MANKFLYDEKSAELALHWLEEFARDSESSVKRQAHRLNWDQILKEGGEPIKLVKQFIESENFVERSERLTMRLDDLADTHPHLALQAARRLVRHADSNEEFLSQQFGHGALTGLGKLIMGAYEGFADDAPQRQEALDLFDRFLAAGIYDIDRVIARYERH